MGMISKWMDGWMDEGRDGYIGDWIDGWVVNAWMCKLVCMDMEVQMYS